MSPFFYFQPEVSSEGILLHANVNFLYPSNKSAINKISKEINEFRKIPKHVERVTNQKTNSCFPCMEKGIVVVKDLNQNYPTNHQTLQIQF